jgi:uncharacterized protein (TIGR00369 family)
MDERDVDLPDGLIEAFARVPIVRHFGMRIVSRSSGEALLAMDPLPEHLQEEGIVQGGVLSALADTAAVYTLYPELPAGRTMTSIEFKMNFLRPATPDRGPVAARARVVQRGRRIALCEVDVTQADKLVARGSFTYLLFDRGE